MYFRQLKSHWAVIDAYRSSNISAYLHEADVVSKKANEPLWLVCVLIVLLRVATAYYSIKLIRKTSSSGFLLIWRALGLIFPKKARERLWAPLIGEDLIDLEEQRPYFTGFVGRQWLRFCFLQRTLIRFIQVLWRVGLDKILYFGVAAGYLFFRSSK